MNTTTGETNYLYGTRQYTRTAALAKDDGMSEAGKTQQSAVSASLDQINLGKDGIAITQVSRQQGMEQSNSQKQSASPQMDTVEISEEGRAASAKLQEQRSDSAREEVYEFEPEDLSEYTDAELKQMYYNGEITRQEYEDETGETLE